MKLFKKLLAVTLAGVLALSVLTGCSGSSLSATDQIAKEMSKSIQQQLGEGSDVKVTGDSKVSTALNAVLDTVKADLKDPSNGVATQAAPAETKELTLKEATKTAIIEALKTNGDDVKEKKELVFLGCVETAGKNLKKQANELTSSNENKCTVYDPAAGKVEKSGVNSDAVVKPTVKGTVKIATTTTTIKRNGKDVEVRLLLAVAEVSPVTSDSAK